MGDFSERVTELQQRVGERDLIGKLEVDTPYAFNQHEKYWINYMGRYGFKPITQYHNGGGEKFVEGPLMANYARYYQNLADEVLEGDVVEAMADNARDMNNELQQNAPEKTGRLKGSGTTSVTDDGSLSHYEAGTRSP